MRMEAPELVNLLNMANDMRKAIDDLPVSQMSNPNACLIANAFNYGCVVHPGDPGGYIYFNDYEDAVTYCIITEAPKESIRQGWRGGENKWEVRLTSELNDIALTFDRGLYPAYQV
jgi:hypothetical protein